ncbi:MAG TPA: stage II sporulation protein M [Candidatus Eremiobacteraceae bacterium]|jgi:uncharacterized membrane protein SpoIIM required for sporulation
MTQRSFVEKRRNGWARLEELLDALQRHGLRRLEAEQVAELGRLYRWVTSDLAYAEGHRFDPALRAHLNRLTARAHSHVYGGGIEQGRARVVRFFTTVFPCEVRASGGYILACAALFALTAAVAYWLVTAKPSNVYAILPAELIAPIHQSLHDSNFAFDRDYASTMSAAIIANNIRVASMCFAGGMTLGIFTVYELIFTGFMVGGLGALFANAGFGPDYFATIAPHGVIELTSIVIASAAGLLLAAGVLAPGRLRRIDALKRNAQRAGLLILGVSSMLVVAGIIEGFYSPQRFPPVARLAMGAVTGVAMAWYFTFAGRRRSPAIASTLQ